MARTPLRVQLGEALEQIEELQRANEQVYSDYTMLNRRVEELSYIDLNNITEATEDVIPQAKRVATINRIRRLRHENPMAKQAVKLALRFVLGKGVSYEIREPNTKRIVDDFWGDPVNQAVWTSHFAMVQRFDELMTDGEQFVALFTTPSETPYVRLGILKMEEVTHIITDPDNDHMPVWYRRVFKKRKWDPTLNDNEGGWAVEKNGQKPIVRYYRDYRVSDEYLADIEKRGLAIPESLQARGADKSPVFVKHRMINPVKMRTGLRGISELFASREWFRVIKEFMEDRGAINAMANAMAIQRKITGGPVAVANMTGRIGGLQVTPDQPLVPSSFRRPLPGSILDTNTNVDYKSIRADTGAPGADRDAGRLIAIAGAGTATPDHYFGGTNSTLAGAQSVEVAVVKAFEDFQTFLRNDDRELTEFVIGVARDLPVHEVDADDKEVAWKFPPIMTQDLVKWVTGLAQWAQQIAPKNRVIRREAIRAAATVLNMQHIDLIWDEVEADEKRIAQEEDEMREQQMQQQKVLAAGGPPGANGASKNGNGGPPGGQRSTTGVTVQGKSPDLTRSEKLKPPREGATGPRSRREAQEAEAVELPDFSDMVRKIQDEGNARIEALAQEYTSALTALAERPPQPINITLPPSPPPPAVTIEKGAVQVDVQPAQVDVTLPKPAAAPAQKPVRKRVKRDNNGLVTEIIEETES